MCNLLCALYEDFSKTLWTTAQIFAEISRLFLGMEALKAVLGY
jgi:hypothetical protein